MSGESAEQFSSLTAIKMAALAESPVTYEQLADLEHEFEEVETEVLRFQYEKSKPLYEKREAILKQIPNFWPLVLEQAPPDIDEFIQPLDANVLLSLKSLQVSRFEIENGGKGDPRSVAIRFEFAENEHFEDKVIEKKFYYRYARDYEGLVSEPVEIKWKDAKKDLTDGLLSLVKKVYDEDAEAFTIQYDANGKEKKREKPLTDNEKLLKEKMDATALNGISFFAWFGYVGRRISAEESAAQLAKIRKEIQERKDGKAEEKEEDEDMDVDDDDEDEDDFEIFPPGDELAQAIVMDLWPEALKYFTSSAEIDDASDMDFESDDEEEAPPLKKVKG